MSRPEIVTQMQFAALIAIALDRDYRIVDTVHGEGDDGDELLTVTTVHGKKFLVTVTEAPEE